MFTGIIEETGKVIKFTRLTNGADIEIKADKVLDGTNIGDSICVNGVCQTVVSMSENSFRAKLSGETLNVTCFDDTKTGDCVNLERALTLKTRLGGHIVSGHVDCKAKLIRIEKLADFYNIYFEIPKEYDKYIVKKGSVTINGISLTTAQTENNIFCVAIIPHTWENTNMKYLKTGDFVNIETDILGKYVEKMLSANNNKNSISMEFLQENGFV